MIDITSNSGWLACTLRIIHIEQMIIQGLWLNESQMSMLPHIDKSDVSSIAEAVGQLIPDTSRISLMTLKQLHVKSGQRLYNIFDNFVGKRHSNEIRQFLHDLPVINIELKVIEVKNSTEHNIALAGNSKYTFTAGADLDFEFALFRRGSDSLAVHSNKFSKQKDESWLLCVGLAEEDALLGMKRLSFRRKTSATLRLKAPARRGMVKNTFS